MREAFEAWVEQMLIEQKVGLTPRHGFQAAYQLQQKRIEELEETLRLIGNRKWSAVLENTLSSIQATARAVLTKDKS